VSGWTGVLFGAATTGASSWAQIYKFAARTHKMAPSEANICCRRAFGPAQRTGFFFLLIQLQLQLAISNISEPRGPPACRRLNKAGRPQSLSLVTARY